MTDFATLVMGVDARGMKEGTTALDAIATKADAAEAKVTKATGDMSKAMGAVAPAAQKAERAMASAGMQMVQTAQRSGNMGFAIQNAAYQVGDFFVMIEGGISPMRALATQLPQMLGSFGVMGAVIGGVVAAGSALVPMMFNMGKNAKEAGEALDDASASLDAFQTHAKIAGGDIETLIEKYGRYAFAIRDANAAQAEQDLANTRQALKSGDLVAGLSDVTKAYAGLSQAVAALPMAGTFGAGLTDELVAQRENVALLRQEVEGAASAMGLNVTKALELDGALATLSSATGPADMADAAGKALAVLSAIPPEVVAAHDELRAAKDQLLEVQEKAAAAQQVINQMPGALNAATTAAGGLAGAMNTVAMGANAALSQMIQMDVMRQTMQSAAQRQAAAPGGIGPAGMANGATAYASNTARKLAEAQAAADRLAASIGKAVPAAAKSAKGGKAVKDTLDDAEKSAKAFADAMQGQVKNALDATVDQMMGGFKDGIKGLLQSWGDAIRQMIGMAIKSKLTSYLFGGGSAIAGTAAAAGTAASGAGTGLLSGALGAWGASGAIGTGFLGGLQASISGGLGGIFSVGANAAAAGGGLAASLGAIAAPLAAVALLFGAFKTKTTLLDAGLKVTVDGLDTLVQQFQTINKKKLFGLISNTRTNVSDVDAKTAAAVGQAVTSVRDGVTNAAASLGVAASAFDDFSYSLSVSTKGMTDDQAAQAVQDAFAGMGDAMAALVPGLDAFIKPAEGAATALSRLSNAATAVNAMADTLGLAFKAVGLSGAALASDLVDKFGSLDALASATGAYYQAFYTDAERLDTLTRQTSAAMSKLGLAMPTSAAGFRALVDAQDLSTEAGRSTFAALIGLSGAMSEILGTTNGLTSALGSTREALQAYIDSLTGTASELISPSMALANAQAAYARTLAGTMDGTSSASDLTQAATALLSATRDTAGTAEDVARAQANIIAQLNAVAGGGLVNSSSTAPDVAASPVATATQANADAITALKAEVATLSDLMAQIGTQTVTFAKRTAEALQKWDVDGLPATRT